ncbi:MAG: hypothetical protein ABI054_12255 [Planctomycetota bacterium]
MLLAIAFTLVAIALAGLLAVRDSSTPTPEPVAELPSELPAELSASLVLPSPPPLALARQELPSSSQGAAIAIASPWTCLADTLRRGTTGPAEWETQVASCADEWGTADSAALRAGAIDERLPFEERLAALELVRALGAEAGVQPTPAQESELREVAFGAEASGTKCWAAAAAVAAFAGAEGREQLLGELEALDASRVSVALHGLRRGARSCLLADITARLAGTGESANLERLCVAAQCVARPLGEQAQGADSQGAAELLGFASRSDVPPTARRRLLIAAASLGDAATEIRLCDIVCDPGVEAQLAREIAQALRASPRNELSTELEQRMRSAAIDADLRKQLSTTCGALRTRDAQNRASLAVFSSSASCR